MSFAFLFSGKRWLLSWGSVLKYNVFVKLSGLNQEMKNLVIKIKYLHNLHDKKWKLLTISNKTKLFNLRLLIGPKNILRRTSFKDMICYWMSTISTICHWNDDESLPTWIEVFRLFYNYYQPFTRSGLYR